MILDLFAIFEIWHIAPDQLYIFYELRVQLFSLKYHSTLMYRKYTLYNI